MDEAFGMDAISDIENGLALFENERGLVVVDHGRGEQPRPGVTVLVVVPPKKTLTESATVLDAPESGPGTPADTSGFGTGSRKTDCRRRRAADYASS